MKKTFLLVAAAAMMAATSALAADLPMKAGPMAAPVFSWTGCYVGAHAGAGLMHETFTASQGGTTGGDNFSGNGGLAGGQIGCNYQTGIFVGGLEGEGYWSGIKSTYDQSSLGNAYVLTTKNKDDFSIAARLGLAYGRVLVYGKVGWVWGEFDMHFNNSSEASSGSATLDGALFGLGLEYALTEHWTVKGEYNYLNYASKDVTYTYTGGGADYRSQGANKQIFKIGANYLFNADGPVVAKY